MISGKLNRWHGKSPLSINKSRKQKHLPQGLHFTPTHFYILAHSWKSWSCPVFLRQKIRSPKRSFCVPRLEKLILLQEDRVILELTQRVLACPCFSAQIHNQSLSFSALCSLNKQAHPSFLEQPLKCLKTTHMSLRSSSGSNSCTFLPHPETSTCVQTKQSRYGPSVYEEGRATSHIRTHIYRYISALRCTVLGWP